MKKLEYRREIRGKSSKCRLFQYLNIKKAASDRDLRLPIFRDDTKQDLFKDSAAKRSKFYSEGILTKFIL
ncbi:hypothetical protein VSWAT3_14197 [Vibrionales bacterium SWAT-3]|nr:hypothetical protein VSWAT3_14197 [Vibrionales bacterium SWAT-3]